MSIKINLNSLEPAKKYPSSVINDNLPSFATYHEDINKLKQILEPYQKYSKLIIIGNGGSITSFQAYLRALKGSGKKVFILNTNEPDLIVNIKKEYKPANTLILVISKSSGTVSVLETLLAFIDYPVVGVCEPGSRPLRDIGALKGWTIIDHPQIIGGRFSGFTSAGLAPAYLFGAPIERIVAGAKKMYELCDKRVPPEDNPAWKIASAIYSLYIVGRDELFIPHYSYYLSETIPLIVQLIHESLGKNGRGLSVIGVLAPESQHNTNQRFFGGKRNMTGIFVTIERQRNDNLKTTVPRELRSIKLKDGKLRDLDGISLEQALRNEYLGTKQDALAQKLPIIDIVLERMDSQHIGQYIALWHYITYYLAKLLKVNPFDQPQVETSKEISWQLRRNK